MSDVHTLMFVGGPEILAEVVAEDANSITIKDAVTLVPIQIPVFDDQGNEVIDKRTGKPEVRHTLTFLKFGLGHDDKKTLVINKNSVVFWSPNVPAALVRMYQSALGRVVTTGQQGIVVP